MKEFSDKMQLMNASGYQGIFEAAGHKLNDIGGVMLWKLNAAFPSVVWQVYDWYMMPNAGYYFMQNACEPVHIQFNVKDLNVEYINRTYKPVKALTSTIEVYDIKSAKIYSQMEKVDLAAPEAKEGLSVADVIKKNQEVSFVVLNLKDASGKIISHNVYWISQTDDFKSLGSLQRTSLSVKTSPAQKLKNETRWSVEISNNTDKLAFFINPRLMSGEEEVTPCFWSANYFSLAPGESIKLTIGCPPEALVKGKAWLKVEGWNVQEMVLQL
jgi:hypothetical protein